MAKEAEEAPLYSERLWKWLILQNEYIFQEFGLAILGIGALLWAYGQVNWDYLKEFIVWVGLGGSLIIWVHMYGSRKEVKEITNELKKTEGEFFKRFSATQSWRGRKLHRFFYYPVTRLAYYFMGLVSWGWFTIILIHHFTIPIETLTYVTLIPVLSTAVVAVYRRYKDGHESTDTIVEQKGKRKKPRKQEQGS